MFDVKSPVRAALVVALALAVSACGGESSQDAGAPEAAVPSAPDAAPADVSADPALAGSAEAPGAAQPGNPMVGPMPALGGGMQALAEHCGGYSAAELADLKQQQRALAIQSGMSGANFDAEYTKGYNDALAKVRQGTPAEREKACAQLEAFKQFGEQMEQRGAMPQR
ncbi:hypothetical protein [Luteimonas arsenica]|uniref:hypothetical protein n=1 Tax=Luteimonas arsenica TaxID=1586242 RepID=UPI00105488F4|nr:hypothetical protein [Luteimonas arsenica]